MNDAILSNILVQIKDLRDRQWRLEKLLAELTKPGARPKNRVRWGWMRLSELPEREVVAVLLEKDSQVILAAFDPRPGEPLRWRLQSGERYSMPENSCVGWMPLREYDIYKLEQDAVAALPGMGESLARLEAQLCAAMEKQ